MKNITFSAEDRLIEEARKQAAGQNTTLNNLFREWLEQYTARQQAVRKFDETLEKLSYFRTDRKYTREEMNQR